MKSIKGIILAGGYGSRLYPLTLGVSKQLLPVYDKPMIYYPLSTLMQAGIIDILIISTKNDISKFEKLLGNGTNLGIKLSYAIQENPNGIAEALIIASDFILHENICLILGDNIFHGDNFIHNLEKAKVNLSQGYSTIFGIDVENPNDFGVIELNSKNKIKKIIEKPKTDFGSLIVTGLYYFTNDAIKIAKNLKPSLRGELEITDINNSFLNQDKLKLIRLNSEIVWTDTGTYNSLISASQYFKDYEIKYSKKIACIEEIAYRRGYIDEFRLKEIAQSMINSDYGKYLNNLAINED